MDAATQPATAGPDRRRLAFRLALPAFAAGKTISLLVALLTVWSQSQTPAFPQRHEFLDAFGFWDGQNYLHIAGQGYPSGPLDVHAGQPGHYWGFLPGYPLMISAVNVLLRDLVVSGVVVSAVAELAALTLLALLVLDLRGGDETRARTAVWLLALYPYGFFLTAVYTESAFLAAAIAALYLARRGRNGAACAAATLAVAIRITGFALIPALAWEYLRRRRWRPGPGLALVPLTAAPLLLFMAWARNQTGDAMAYFDIQRSESFGSKTLVNPLTALRNTWDAATAGGPASNDYLFFVECVFGVAGFVVLVAMCVPWARGAAMRWRGAGGDVATARSLEAAAIPIPLILYAIGAWVLPVSLTYWLSVPRYEVAMVPAFILLADLLARRPPWRWAVIAVSGGLLAYTTSIFASGRFLA